MKTHLVSQVLLRRYAINNLVGVYNISGKTMLNKATKEIGFINTNEDVFKQSENRWSVIETRAAKALRSIESGELLKNPVSVMAIKQLMALHFIRSQSFVYLSSKREHEAYAELIESISNKYSVEIANIEKFRLNWLSSFQKSMPEIFERSEKKIFEFIDHFDLEIGEAPEGSSIILGDNPVVNMTNDGRMGMLQGVAFDQSDNVIIPLGPKYVAALITKNPITSYRKLTNGNVNNLNLRILNQCIKEYYSLPIER